MDQKTENTVQLNVANKNIELAREDISHIFSINDVCSIYEFGHINHPQLSDIDIIVVAKNAPSDGLARALDRAYQSEIISAALEGGTIMVVPVSEFKNLLLIDDLSLRHLYGQQLSSFATTIDLESRTIAQIMDWLPERVFSLNRAITQCHPTNIVFGLVNSLLRTLFMVGRRVGNAALEKLYGGLKTKLQGLVADWDYGRGDELIDLATYILYIGQMTINLWALWLQDHGYYTYTTTSRAKFDIPSLCSFSTISNVAGSVRLPYVWFMHWAVYARANGYISNKINNNLDYQGHGLVQPRFTQHLLAKMRTIDRMATFLAKNNIKRGLIKFGWFYP